MASLIIPAEENYIPARQLLGFLNQDFKKADNFVREYNNNMNLKPKLPSPKDFLSASGRKEEKKHKETEHKKRKQSELPDYYQFSYNERSVVVSYSEKLRLQDEKKRQRLLDKLNSLCKEGKIPAGKMVKNTGFRRYLKTLKGSVEIDEEKIVRDRLWDGVYGVCYNIKQKGPEEALKMYRSLWKIEELFRINKHTLKMRPIYHRLRRRIRAHILICFLAYTVLRWTEIELAKKDLSFSPQQLIDILKRVGVFIIQDK